MLPAPNTLYIGSGGITVNSGAGAVAIGYAGGVNLIATSMSVTNNSFNLLTLAGGLSSWESSGTTTFTLGGGGNITSWGAIANGTGANSVALIKSGTGSLTLYGTNTYSGTTTISGGTLQIGSGGSGGSLSSSSAITNNATLVFMRGNTMIQGSDFGVIGGVGQLIQSGRGTLVLNSANTYSGSTSMTAGTLTLAHQYAVQNSTLTMSGSCKLVLDSSVAANAFTLGGLSASKSGTGFDIALQNSAGDPINLSVGNNNTNTTYAGYLSGSGSLTKVGTGSLTLVGQNNYTGPTTICGGSLNLACGVPLVNSTIVMSGTGTVTFDSSVTTNAFALFRLRGTGQIALQNTAGSTITLTFLTSTNETFAGVFSGSGSLRMSATGTLTLTGANTFSGSTTLVLGNLILANQYALQNSSLGAGNYSGVIFDSSVTANAFTLGGINAGNVLLENSASIPITLTVGNNNVTSNYSGIFSGSGSLIKVGTGTFTLWNKSTYAGTTTISGGTLQIGGVFPMFPATNQGSMGSGAVTNNAALIFKLGGTVANAISGTGTVTLSTGTLTLSGTSTYTGATNVNAGKLLVNGSLGNTAITIASSASLGGSGTIGGTVTVSSGGHLAPGNSPGVLTINNSLTLNSGSISDFEIASTSSYDQVAGLPSVTYGGTLNITGTIASTSNRYTLFSTSSHTGTFSAINLAAAPTGCSWHDFDPNTAGIQAFDYTTGSIQLDAFKSATVRLSAVSSALSSTNRADATHLNDDNGTTALGKVHVTGTDGHFVSEIDGLTDATGNSDFADGYVQADGPLSPTPTLVMLWLKDTNLSDSIGTSEVIGYLSSNAGGAYTVLASSDAAWQKLAEHYSGFDTIIEFNQTMGTGDAFSWSFGGDYATIHVDKVAVVPEPGSLSLLGLGALGLMGSRRRKERGGGLGRYYGRL